MTKIGSHHSIFIIKAEHLKKESFAKKILNPARRAQFLRQKHNLDSAEEFLKKTPMNKEVAKAIETLVKHPELKDYKRIFKALAIIKEEEPECKIYIHKNLEKYNETQPGFEYETSKHNTVRDGGEIRDNLIKYNNSGVLIFNIPAHHTHEKLTVQIGDKEIAHADPLQNLPNRSKTRTHTENQHAFMYNMFEEHHALIVSGNGLFFSENPHDKKYKRTKKMETKNADEIVSEQRAFSRLGDVQGDSPVKGFFFGFFSDFEY